MNRIKAIATVVLVIAVVVMAASYPYLTYDEVTAKVIDKERITGKESSYYLIFTEGETFKNADSLVYFKFNSSDLYGLIKEGDTYKFGVYGWRIPVFSAYRNIVKVKR